MRPFAFWYRIATAYQIQKTFGFFVLIVQGTLFILCGKQSMNWSEFIFDKSD